MARASPPTPSMSGIERSIRTTSGRSARASSTASWPPPAAATTSRSSARGRAAGRGRRAPRRGPRRSARGSRERHLHAHPRTRAGRRVDDELAAGVAHEVAHERASRSDPRPRGRRSTAGVEAAAVVGDLAGTRGPLRRASVIVDVRPRRRASRRCAAPPARSGTTAPRRPPAASSASSASSVVVDAAGAERPGEIAQRRHQPGLVQARRVDVDQQRTQRAHARRAPARRPSQRRRARRGRPRARLPPTASRRRPTRSCTTPSCRSAAIRRRSSSDASIARRSSPRARAGRAQPARQRPGQRQLDEPEQQQAAEQRRQEGEPQPAAAGRHRAVALVGLEQQRLAVRARGPAGRPRSSLPWPRSKRFSGWVRSLTSASTPPSQRAQLVRAERVARADQPRLVGVDDPPVARPQLHPHDAVAQHVRRGRCGRARASARRVARRAPRGVRFGPTMPWPASRVTSLGVADRLVACRAPDHRTASSPMTQRGQQARDCELDDGRPAARGDLIATWTPPVVRTSRGPG